MSDLIVTDEDEKTIAAAAYAVRQVLAGVPAWAAAAACYRVGAEYSCQDACCQRGAFNHAAVAAAHFMREATARSGLAPRCDPVDVPTSSARH